MHVRNHISYSMKSGFYFYRKLCPHLEFSFKMIFGLYRTFPELHNQSTQYCISYSEHLEWIIF